ncbi:MAG TPA: Hsp20/alpha crystallin family protein [Mycobacteriales bacterium]
MSVQRWNPFGEIVSPRDAMSRLLDEDVVLSMSPGAELGLALDLEETPDAYIVRAGLPGFRPEDVNVSLAGDTLTIQAERESEEERKDRDYLVRERRTGLVRRTISLPGRVDADRVEARYENGELVLTLPKSEESKPRRIAIGGGQGQQQLSGRGAYQYGYSAGQSEQYRGREFDEAEGDLRGDYERQQGRRSGIEEMWERLREEIREGWNRARGK